MPRAGRFCFHAGAGIDRPAQPQLWWLCHMLMNSMNLCTGTIRQGDGMTNFPSTNDE
jgi:hypothetical protein